MTEKNSTAAPKILPKRFIDRKDYAAIIDSTGNFAKRGHEHVPNWMINIFVLTQLVFVGMMIYFAMQILNAQQQKTEVLNIIQYMLVSFVIVTCYSLFIVKRLKKSLTATEFMSLFLAKSLETYSGSFCLINRLGKIIYYNTSFASDFMSANDVETKTYVDLLDRNTFDDKHMEKIADSLQNNVANSFSLVSSTNTSQTMRNIRMVPLERPSGLFVLQVVTVEIVKSKAKPA